MDAVISRNERRWHWRTWNLLLQIREATDGNDPRQRSGEMTTRGLCVAEKAEIKAMDARGWIRAFDVGEVFDDNGNSRYLPIWEVTPSGRAALKAAEEEGIEFR